MRPCPPCGNPCNPCTTSPFNCPPGGAVCSMTAAPLFAQAVSNTSLPGGTVTPAIVPGMMTAAFSSAQAEQLLIDASAFVQFGGLAGPVDVFFQVLVDGTVVTGSEFGTLVNDEAAGRYSSGTTLVVPVAAGAHVVSVQWSSASGSVGSEATIIAGNLRVQRFACV